MADRDITLSLDLDVTDAMETSKKLQSKIDDIFNSQDGTDTPALTSLTKQMKDTALEAQQVRAELEKIGSQKVETEKYKEQQQILQEFEAELSKLKAQET